MEKAIFKTLIYASIFNYPLKFRELQKWLIGKKVEVRVLEKKLNSMSDEAKIGFKNDFYYLKGGQKNIKLRLQKIKTSGVYFKKAQIISWLVFRIIPWIKLIGISGGLAMENAGKKDDIDLFLITSKNRLWLVRILVLIILSFLGQRRRRGESRDSASGKICCNLMLEEDNLVQKRQNLYIAHEVLQMKVLYQRENVYFKYLIDNEWAFRFLPNWVSNEDTIQLKRKNRKRLKKVGFFNKLFNRLETYAKNLQIKKMGQVEGLERIEEGGVYFHPEDYQLLVLEKYRKLVSYYS